MKIKITRTTVAADGFVKPGQVLDLPEGEARLLIGINKAVPWDSNPEAEIMTTDIATAMVGTEAKKSKGRRK
jgi:ubiquinone/menaquinone biosynthesis C-methylase UbiE